MIYKRDEITSTFTYEYSNDFCECYNNIYKWYQPYEDINEEFRYKEAFIEAFKKIFKYMVRFSSSK